MSSRIQYSEIYMVLDFAFLVQKVALEIDGKQHEYVERKLKDLEKDNWLNNLERN